MPRTFIAIPVDEIYWQSLRDIQHQLQIAGVKYRLIRSENFHITAAFLGELLPEQIDKLITAMADVLGGYKPISAVTTSLTGFPSPSHTRAIAVKLSGKNTTKLQRQVSAIRKALQKKAIWFDPVPFVPHITIGRIDRGRDLSLLFPLSIEHTSMLFSSIDVFISERDSTGVMKYTPAKRYLERVTDATL